MEIRVLQYFMAVARHENITKAAEELHLTQLTEAGLIFKARAQEIFSLTEKTKEQFAKMDELVAGDIYMVPARRRRWPMSRKSWRRSYPHIQFYLVSGNSAAMKT